MAQPLKTDKPDRKLWLLKVPPAIAARWEAASAAGPSGAAIDEDDDARGCLGTVMLSRDAQGKDELLIDVSGLEAGDPTPRRYRLALMAGVHHTRILSYEERGTGAQAGEPPGLRPSVEGVVDKKYDLVPAVARSTAGQVGTAAVVDEAYAAFNRQRTRASGPKARPTIQVLDASAARKLTTTNAEPLWDRQRKSQLPDKAAKLEAKRLRLDRDDLEALLFKEFERSPYMTFHDLKARINQPVAWLKEVLGQVAVQVRSGPHKDEWELKKEYRTTARPADVQAAGST